MRTLWLNLSGTPAARQAHKTQRLNYPLCFNVPQSCFCAEKKSIQLSDRTTSPGLYIDIVVQVGKDLTKASVSEIGLAIDGYRWCVGISDKWFLDQVGSPSIRDKGVCLYYSRWSNGYNVLGSLMDVSFEDLIQKRFEFIIGNEKLLTPLEFEHNPGKVISFLSDFITLSAGDLVSLGSVVILEDLGEIPVSVSILEKDYSWSVDIIR
ncbi:MAG: fumarylacetoacetate hydrolase family protein [Deltaproteobacteria bacterium]|nr:fumarylacetoacetate hydrolase family protein [Deltaproteobacteria bacterium]